MAWTWGDAALNIQRYSRKEAELYLSEHRLIPDPAADHDTSPSSVLMGAGRGRVRRSIEGWAVAADFAAMESDKHDMTARILTLAVGDTLTAIIESLSGALDVQRGNIVWYSATFVEV